MGNGKGFANTCLQSGLFEVPTDLSRTDTQVFFFILEKKVSQTPIQIIAKYPVVLRKIIVVLSYLIKINSFPFAVWICVHHLSNSGK